VVPFLYRHPAWPRYCSIVSCAALLGGLLHHLRCLAPRIVRAIGHQPSTEQTLYLALGPFHLPRGIAIRCDGGIEERAPLIPTRRLSVRKVTHGPMIGHHRAQG